MAEAPGHESDERKADDRLPTFSTIHAARRWLDGAPLGRSS
jgi:hypothetical protein